MHYLTYLTTHWTEIALIITSVISAASAISAITPTPEDDKIVAKVMAVVNVLGLNVRHATNAQK
jgi:hypothetical protein